MDVDIASFLAITGDTNPIHTDHDAATLAGFSAPIIPGSLMASMFPTIIGTQYPGSIYLTQTLKFRAPATVSFLFFVFPFMPSPVVHAFTKT